MRWGVGAAALLLTACVSQLPQIKRDLGPQAAEQLACDEKSLAWEAVSEFIFTTRVKVKGCGKETTWVLQESRWTKER